MDVRSTYSSVQEWKQGEQGRHKWGSQGRMYSLVRAWVRSGTAELARLKPFLHDQGRQGKVQVTKTPSWDNAKGRLARIVTQGPSKGSSTCKLQTEPRKEARVLSPTSALPAASILGHSREAVAPTGSVMMSPTNLISGYSVATKKPALAQDAIYKAEKRDSS